jgi:hypothetical protein
VHNDRKSRPTESSHKSEAVGFLLDMAAVLLDLLPDSVNFLTTLILCAAVVMAERFFVGD